LLLSGAEPLPKSAPNGGDEEAGEGESDVDEAKRERRTGVSSSSSVPLTPPAAAPEGGDVQLAKEPSEGEGLQVFAAAFCVLVPARSGETRGEHVDQTGGGVTLASFWCCC